MVGELDSHVKLQSQVSGTLTKPDHWAARMVAEDCGKKHAEFSVYLDDAEKSVGGHATGAVVKEEFGIPLIFGAEKFPGQIVDRIVLE